MPHDIIDNRTRELAPEIKAFLADSIRAHFADQRSNLCSTCLPTTLDKITLYG